ncbi:MAG: sugar transferase [Nitrospina sp.]|nr:sugar transferase [Nitrospina sp.]MBT7197075.1 sugar transferase [Nitrospina sp.]
MNRPTNLTLALVLGVIIFPLTVLIGLLVRLTSRGPAIHWSSRVGKENKIFNMPKFRTMRLNTPDVATHLLTNGDQFVTPIGKFLRKTSLDEIPQLWSILKGDMAFVGPRPALHNQDDLIDLRTQKGIHRLTPGITGWAQIKGRDELPIPEKVEMDFYYIKNRSTSLDLKIIWHTFFAVFRSKGIAH